MYKECTLCKCHLLNHIENFPIDLAGEIGGLCFRCSELVRKIENQLNERG